MSSISLHLASIIILLEAMLTEHSTHHIRTNRCLIAFTNLDQIEIHVLHIIAASQFKECATSEVNSIDLSSVILNQFTSQPSSLVLKPCSQYILHCLWLHWLHSQTSHPFSSVLNPNSQFIVHMASGQAGFSLHSQIYRVIEIGGAS